MIIFFFLGGGGGGGYHKSGLFVCVGSRFFLYILGPFLKANVQNRDIFLWLLIFK